MNLSDARLSPLHRSLAVATFVLITPALGAQGAVAADTGVTITFLANEGVMLSGGGKKVIIDGLFLKYKQGFALPAESTQALLRTARAPFDSVDLVLVTHHHGDHFHPEPAAAHLFANPRATLVASPQVIDSMRGRIAAAPAIARRALAREVPISRIRRETVNGVAVEILGLKHHDLQHNGFIVELGGRRILHVGDTDDAASAFAGIGLDTLRVDIALLPAWMGTERGGRAAIERWVRAARLAFFHVGEGAHERIEHELHAAFPRAVVFYPSLTRVVW
jgi:L-ascorbate metabolism protein UlaG (beta-lactamase superfamily)